ncbi:Integral membrane protein [Balamuthia mandrillaris]
MQDEKLREVKVSLGLLSSADYDDDERGDSLPHHIKGGSASSSASKPHQQQQQDMETPAIIRAIPPWLHLVTWLLLNVSLTLLNKAVFSFGDFTFPLALSAVHMLITGVSSWFFVEQLRWFPRNENIDEKGQRMLWAFSFLFSFNIVVGNASLRWVSVSLVQIIRAVIPGMTMVLSYFILGKTSSLALILSMIPICLGVMLTVQGDVEYTALGFFVTTFGSFLSALKVVVCNKFLVGKYKMNPFDLLVRVSGPALLQMLVLSYFLEWEGIQSKWEQVKDVRVLSSIFLSGVMAFLLNVTNFYTNQLTSPLTLTVAGNVKQIITIILSIVIFQNIVTATSGIGMVITIFGAAIYSYLSYKKW